MIAHAVVAAAALAALAAAGGLTDEPLNSGVAPLYLDGEWTVANSAGDISIAAIVPGDLLTDMERAGVIGDPIFEQNFLPAPGGAPVPGAPFGLPKWDNDTFTYSKTFTVPWPSLGPYSDVALVFDGVKMAANVTLNGHALGSVADMFLRYSFAAVGPLLLLGGAPNVLTLAFPTSVDPMNNEGRWDSCSGGWDWSFYSNVANPTNSNMRTFSKGIWRSVYLLPTPASGVAIEHVVPLVYFGGPYPTSALADGANGPWTVATTVHFVAPAAASGTLSVSGDWPGAGAARTARATLPAGNSSLSVTLPGADVQLWWPNRLGAQSMYTASVTWTPDAPSAAPVLADARRIGFRVLYLVTGDDSNASALVGSEGSGNFTMRWKVNGLSPYSFGGNIIPMEEMEGRMSAAAHVQLVATAAAAGFNTLRIWGGGIYAPQAFYDAADAAGLLMYHDAMYSSDGRIPPAATPLEDAELRHNIRRIAHHPSIAHWDACNECDAVAVPIYYTFVATVMAQEDPSRPIWPSCPSQGWATGVSTLTGLPNGNRLFPIYPPPKGDAAAPVVASQRAGSLVTVPRARAPAGGAPGERVVVADSAACTAQVDVDYDVGQIWIVTDAASAGDCCDACSANVSQGCWCATFFEGSCYWKKAGAKPAFSAGRVTVWPAGSGPIPPTPPVYVAVEAHGPYQHGGGFPAVNGNENDGAFNPNIPPTLAPSYSQFGPAAPGIFYSEFGASVWSSFESVAPTLDPAHWGLGGGMEPNPAATCKGSFTGICPGPNPIAQRNYPPHSFIETYFGNVSGIMPSLNETGTLALQRQLYLATLAQGLEMKSDISSRRSSPHTGTVYWQLNEIWPTGGWGSVEYGTVGFTPGQVLGGRWKPLHHFVSAFLYQDVFLVVGADGRVLVRNDGPLGGVVGTARVAAVRLAPGGGASPTPLMSAPIDLPAGFGAVAQLCLGAGNASAGCETLASLLPRAGCAADGSDCVLLTSVTSAAGAVLAASWELLTVPGSLRGLVPTALTASVAAAPNADGSVNVTVTSPATSPSLFVSLLTTEQGRFADNVVIMPAATWTTRFIGFPETAAGGAPVDIDALAASLRVEHLGQYIA